MSRIFTTDERTVYARHFFPNEWARVEHVRSKSAQRKRYKLREKAEDEVLRGILENAKENCGTCKSFSKGRCELYSDFFGEVRVEKHQISSCHSKLDKHRNAKPVDTTPPWE